MARRPWGALHLCPGCSHSETRKLPGPACPPWRPHVLQALVALPHPDGERVPGRRRQAGGVEQRSSRLRGAPRTWLLLAGDLGDAWGWPSLWKAPLHHGLGHPGLPGTVTIETPPDPGLAQHWGPSSRDRIQSRVGGGGPHQRLSPKCPSRRGPGGNRTGW